MYALATPAQSAALVELGLPAPAADLTYWINPDPRSGWEIEYTCAEVETGCRWTDYGPLPDEHVRTFPRRRRGGHITGLSPRLGDILASADRYEEGPVEVTISARMLPEPLRGA
ncbi:hypothetical protein GS502_11060 [Rhodococcus hoagii]|nr:hypothetical protein [Prescottella equi]